MTTLLTKELESINLLKPLTGKVAIVTGAGRGIGAEIARQFADKGAQVIGAYRKDSNEILNVIKEIEDNGGRAVAIKSDIANEDEAKHLIEETIKRFGKVDILVNNAGITRDRSFRKMSRSEWDQVINTNLSGAYNTTHAVIDHMLERKYGRIINISSIIGQSGGFGQANYSAAKAGLIGFTKTLALETAKNGITANVVCPGFIETEMVAAMPEDVKNAIVSKVPMKRLGKTSEVAEAVLYLAQADFVTGQQININGGLYM